MSAPTTEHAPIVLIENADPSAAWAQVEALAAFGLDARVCPGPEGLGEDRCTLVSTGRCHLAETADVVLHDLDLDDDDDREILAWVRRRFPNLPVVVEVPVSVARRYRHALDGCTVVPPFSPEHLASVVSTTVGASRTGRSV